MDATLDRPVSPAAAQMARGAALRAEGRAEEALAAFRTAVELDPERAEAHHQLGNALKAQRRYPEAAASLRMAARLAPSDAVVWLNLGVASLELHRLDEAVTAFRRAIRLEPARPEAHNILGHALLAQGRCTAAKRCLEEALRLRPGYPAAHDNLGRVCKAQGRAAEAVAQHRAALAGALRPETHSNLLYALNFPAGIPRAAVADEHRRWAAVHAAPLLGPPPAAAPESRRPRRLRLGYVSPDFVHHAVSYFFEPVLASRDADAFEVFCYSDAPVADEVTRRLRSRADQWRDIAGLGDERVAALIRADRIDLLVDLAGHTARNRLLVFARRPAPVQATWLGYPNTTGLAAIDFRVTDAVSDPPGQTEAWHTEALVRLDGPFSCYAPPAESPTVSPLPALAAGHVTFGCLNNLAKVTPPTVALWAQLLGAVAGSRLLLKSAGLADAETAARLRAEFAGQGIDPARLDLRGAGQSVARHLAVYHEVDVALDPFPYNGTTTTCEALWMGVPVVTLAGDAHVSRVGASLLTHLDMPECIAEDPAAYVERARGLAGDLARLAALRAALRDRLRASPLCDGPGFTRKLEDAFRAMWRKKMS
jgi:predicted O-linked N-acetylglucosamine transferase (SPINDLY family)